jgi:hypothetical protein
MPTNGTIDPERRDSQAGPQRPLTRSDVLSAGVVSELLGIPCSRSTTSRAAASSPHAALGAVGCSSAIVSPPPSRRSTSPAPGAPGTTTSGATTAIRNSGCPERYSKALLQTATTRPRHEPEAPKPPPLQAL